MVILDWPNSSGLCPETVAINDGEFDDWSFFLPPGWRDYKQASLEEVCAHQWLSANQLALEAKRLVPRDQWIQLRYEDIFDRPVEMFEAAFRQLSIPFGDDIRAHCAALNARPTSIVKGGPRKQKWKAHNPEAIARVLDKIRPLMIQLGYDPDD